MQYFPIIIVCFLFIIVGQYTICASPQEQISVFDYVSCSQKVNIVHEDVVFKCVFSPSVNPDSVRVHILFPNSNSSILDMVEVSTNKYVNITSFATLGHYSFFVSALIENEVGTSVSRSFWISNSLNDKDDDKMNDEWEQFYGFDSTDPSDAFGDYDNDGYKNLDEFTMGTDPLDADYIEFILFHISSHFHLIILTMFFLLITLLCSLYGLRRITRWI
jgi:hypothetical protein